MGDPDRFTFRMRLSSKLHLWATRIYDDFHTYEMTTPSGEVLTFSCYWQWTASATCDYDDRCSCSTPELA